ncbi:O-antigen ligase family protein [Magnetospirillum sp. UT-4]|uniref:O-antigen ligase family protein n=1 Tax=Magnetospirillum sp. UT-4 TaxID=2681467 RepID=UPI0015721590|nr:O-antigen ligase family protein [Magnetospirillum sp. UT-4]
MTVAWVVGVAPVLSLVSNRGLVPLVVLVAVAVVAAAIRDRRRPWHDGTLPPVLAAGLGALILWGFASAAWEHTEGLAVRKALALSAWMACGSLLLAGFARLTAADLVRVTRAAAWGIGGAVALAVAEGWMGMPLTILMNEWRNPDVSVAVNATRFKAGATVVVLLGIPTVAGLAFRGRRLAAGVTLVAVIALAVVSSSLSAMLGLGAAVAAAALCLVPRIGTWAVAAALVAVLAGVPLLRQLPPTEQLAVSLPYLPNSTLHRTMIWKFAADRIAERPLLGWGLEGSRALPGGDDDALVHMHGYIGPADQPNRPLGLIVQRMQQMPLHPHNAPLQIWVELGAIGALLAAAVLLTLLRLANAAAPAVRAPRVATLAAGFAMSTVSFGAWQSWWLMAVWLAALMAVAFTDPVRLATDRPDAGR